MVACSVIGLSSSPPTLTGISLPSRAQKALGSSRRPHTGTQHPGELDSLEQRERLVLYASIGLAFLTFTATNRLFDEGGAGVLVWLALLALCSYGVFWVWTRYRRYE
jgi:hypothetical protein